LAKVAVVGGGAAGIGAAIALTKAGMDVSLFEAEARLGGHCFGVSVSLWDGRTIRVDAGVSDFNAATCGGLCELMHELDLRTSPVNQDVSFMTADRATVWFSRAGQPQIRQRLDDGRAFLDDIDRFNRTCLEVLDDVTCADWPARRYLDDKQYSGAFRRFYFDPRAQAEFSMPDRPADQYSIRSLVNAWRLHGIVGTAPSPRQTVQGGMHTYCEAAERWLREKKATLYLSTRVTSIARPGDGIRLRATDRERANLALSFDHAIIATNPDQTIALLEDAAQDEARLYSELTSRPVRLVVHQDTQMMPADRATWGAYNYVVAHEQSSGARPAVTLYCNRLQNLSASIPDVFVTMNPSEEPDTTKIIFDRLFAHPVIGDGNDAAAQRLDAMQGKRRTWYCGGYLREPFVHAQAYRCGVETAERLAEAVADESRKFEAGVSVSPGGFDDFLRAIPMFADLDARALAEVQLVARPFAVEAGTMLFRQNDLPDGLYLIKRGRIAILRRAPGDELIKLTEFGPNAVVGEMSLLDRNRRSTHAVAVEPTAGYLVSYERFCNDR
jgi:predicted NAD/FAD-binding protein